MFLSERSACSLVVAFCCCFSAITAFRPPPRTNRVRAILFSSRGNSDDVTFDPAELSRRIETLQSAEEQEQKMQLTNAVDPLITELPVICFDALLPGQRLEGSTTDPTFGRFLAEIGLGGLFVMTSLNNKQRKLRRNGVIARIELMDAKQAREDGISPTAVAFEIVGRRKCRIIGPLSDMVARVGRWRRVYDSDGEVSMLGWGEERFVDCQISNSVPETKGVATTKGIETTAASKRHTEWSTNQIDCTANDAEEEADEEELTQKIETITALLEKWQTLASNERTYDNTDVVVTSRRIRGQPGLILDPSKLIQSVLRDLGERPTDPKEFALWAAALVNPLPPLGVSPEIRGRILEAPNVKARLDILEWAVQRSICNLEGTAPL
jgi:hypothetical protein